MERHNLNSNQESNLEENFDTVKFFREVKEKIAKETYGMSFPEFKQYLDNRSFKVTR